MSRITAARELRVEAEGVSLDVAVHGSLGEGPVVLLLPGLGRQRTEWPDELLDGLITAGLTIVTHDHRDAGRSTAMDHLPGDVEDVFRWQRGEPFAVPYRLVDLAADAVALLDHLDLDRVHVVGHSMGGMVAQHLAVSWPERVASLTLVSTTTADPAVGGPSEAAVEAMSTPVALPDPAVDPEAARDAHVAASIARARTTHGPLLDEEREAARIAAAFERSFRPAGRNRQLLAILAESDRTPALRQLDVPTLVVHGPHDGMVAVSGGRALADAIPGAQYLEVPQMGHDLPAPLLPDLVAAVADLVASAD